MMVRIVGFNRGVDHRGSVVVVPIVVMALGSSSRV